jgi:hypothetical protein
MWIFFILPYMYFVIALKEHHAIFIYERKGGDEYDMLSMNFAFYQKLLSCQALNITVGNELH